jgi:hypothetical protein
MSDRFSQPMTRQLLEEMMADSRYWDSAHPDHKDWVGKVTSGYGVLYPGKPLRDSTGRVHVGAYTRQVNGQTVDVSEYWRTAPGSAKGQADNVGAVANDSGVPPAPSGVDIDANITEAEKNWWNPAWFYNQVNSRGPWDYKRRGAEYQNFGNFNYGATGAAMGFSEDTLLRMAGWQQIHNKNSNPAWGSNSGEILSFLGLGGTAPFGDDPEDQIWISRGYKYYNKRKK